MVRYLIFFVGAFAVQMVILGPSDAQFADQHAKAAAMLAEATAMETVRTVSGTRFYFMNNRSRPDGLYWRPRGRDRSAQCIRCPLALDKVAGSVGSLDYLRLSSGLQIIIALRDKDGQALLQRADVIAILKENESLTRQKLNNPAAKSEGWAFAIICSFVGAIIATLAYLGIRLQSRTGSSPG